MINIISIIGCITIVIVLVLILNRMNRKNKVKQVVIIPVKIMNEIPMAQEVLLKIVKMKKNNIFT